MLKKLNTSSTKVLNMFAQLYIDIGLARINPLKLNHYVYLTDWILSTFN